MEKDTLCGRPLVRVRVQIERDTLCGRPWVRVREKKKMAPFEVGL